MRWWPAWPALAVECSTAAIALNIHLEDGRVKRRQRALVGVDRAARDDIQQRGGSNAWCSRAAVSACPCGPWKIEMPRDERVTTGRRGASPGVFAMRRACPASLDLPVVNVAAHRRHLSAIRFHDALLLDHEPLVPLAHSPQLDPEAVAHGRSGGKRGSVERTPTASKRRSGT